MCTYIYYIYNTLWLILTEKYGFLPMDWWKPEPTKTALRAGQSPHHLVDLQNYHYSPVRCGIASLDPRALKTPQSCYIFVTEPPETKNAKCVNFIETPAFLCFCLGVFGVCFQVPVDIASKSRGPQRATSSLGGKHGPTPSPHVHPLEKGTVFTSVSARKIGKT